MKIAFIGQKGIPVTFGGVEYHVDRLSREIVKRGVSVTVYVRSWYTPKEDKEFEAVKLIHIPTVRSKHLDASLHSLFSSIHAVFSKTDIVHYHGVGPAFFSFIPGLFGKKIVVTIHRLDWATEKWGRFAKIFLKLGELISTKVPHGTIVISRELKEYFTKKYKRCNLFYITHGIGSVKKVEAKVIIQKYDLHRHEYLLYLGRLSPEKRVEWIIKAFIGLKNNSKKNKKIKLVIAGGSSSTDKYVNSLKRTAAGHKEIIFTGYVSGREKEELLSNAKIFVMASYLEGYPIALMEAKNYGNCCLVSNIPPHCESVTNGVDGFLFESSDFEDLEEKLDFLLNDHAQIELSGKNAREKMSKMPDWPEVAEETIDVYKKILNKSG